MNWKILYWGVFLIGGIILFALFKTRNIYVAGFGFGLAIVTGGNLAMAIFKPKSR